ncbi:NYN domain-containing protein [Candidatus Pacearchaeota archaeon]|nr:NYN domain-containing protein [Candidatus Pacearchaeota archaeon]
MEKKQERASIFIDGSNLYHNLKRNNIKISFEEIIECLETKREIIGIFYYTAEL